MNTEIKAVRKSNYKHKGPDYYIYEAVNPPKARPSAIGALDLMVGNFAVEGLEGWVFSPFYPYLTTDGDITDCETEEQAIARGWSWQSKHWKSTRGICDGNQKKRFARSQGYAQRFGN